MPGEVPHDGEEGNPEHFDVAHDHEPGNKRHRSDCSRSAYLPATFAKATSPRQGAVNSGNQILTYG